MSPKDAKSFPLLDVCLSDSAKDLDLDAPSRARIVQYLRKVLDDFQRCPKRQGVPESTTDKIAESVFNLLTSRTFCYLGRVKANPYRDTVLDHLRRDIACGSPVRFFFDIGPGYHASIAPGKLDLKFRVGFAEQMLLRQVARFNIEVERIYTPGAHFSLVVDNLCGLATNDVPLSRTRDYISNLRALIALLGHSDSIEVLAESEVNEWSTYEAKLNSLTSSPRTDPSSLSENEIDNVGRFLGRPVTSSEAASRIDRYRHAGWVTEELLKNAIKGVRLTQRHTESTLGFRAFPGGAQRIQVGELALVGMSSGEPRPVLITSRNMEGYKLAHIEVPDVLPFMIENLLVGEEMNG